LVTTTVVVALSLGLAVTGTLWQRSETARQQAEASKLLALAQLRLEEDPTEALAYTMTSLELADTEEARVFAMRLLWEVPPALELEQPGSRVPKFSPDGSRLAASGHTEEVRVWTAEGGDPPLVLPGHQPTPRDECGLAWASNELLVTGDGGWPTRRCYVWRLPEGERVRTIDFGGPSFWQVGPDTLFAETQEDVPGRQVLRLRSWRLPDAEPHELGRVDSRLAPFANAFVPNGRGWLYPKGESIYLRPLPAGSGRDDRLVGRHPTKIAEFWPLWGDPVQVYSADQAGEIRIWDFSEEDPKLAKLIPRQEGEPVRVPDPSGRWALSSLAHAAGPIGSYGSGRQARVWDLDAWPEARPLTLRRSGSWNGAISAFHPRGDWLVISTQRFHRLTFWPLRGDRPSVVNGYSVLRRPLAFSPDGQWLATSWPPSPEQPMETDTLRLWPLPGSGSREAKTLALPEMTLLTRLVFDPHGRFLFVVGLEDSAYVVPLDGSPPRTLESFSEDTFLAGAAVSPSGRRVATAFTSGQGPRTLRVWDLETGELELFDLPEGSSLKTGKERGIVALAFADESTLYTAGGGGVHRWNLESGAHELVLRTEPGHRATMALHPDGRTALVHVGQVGNPSCGPVEILDLATSEMRTLPAIGGGCSTLPSSKFALDASGTVVASGDREGMVWVGRVSGGEPHLLVGHEGPVDYLAVSPDRRWIASTGDDDTLRLWPMPDLSKPPLHTLPHDELIAKLKSLTNLRVVRDPESTEGWKVELDPFPGWKKVPVW
jgi:WD40 repeat protein